MKPICTGSSRQVEGWFDPMEMVEAVLWSVFWPLMFRVWKTRKAIASFFAQFALECYLHLVAIAWFAFMRIVFGKNWRDDL